MERAYGLFIEIVDSPDDGGWYWEVIDERGVAIASSKNVLTSAHNARAEARKVAQKLSMVTR